MGDGNTKECSELSLPAEGKRLFAKRRSDIGSPIPSLSSPQGLNVIHQHLHSTIHVAVIGNDQVAIVFCGFDELSVHRSDKPLPVSEDGIKAVIPLCRVSSESPGQPNMLVGLDEYFQIDQFGQFRMKEDKQAFHDDNRSWLHGDRFGTRQRIIEGVFLNHNRFAFQDFSDIIS